MICESSWHGQEERKSVIRAKWIILGTFLYFKKVPSMYSFVSILRLDDVIIIKIKLYNRCSNDVLTFQFHICYVILGSTYMKKKLSKIKSSLDIELKFSVVTLEANNYMLKSKHRKKKFQQWGFVSLVLKVYNVNSINSNMALLNLIYFSSSSSRVSAKL